MLTKQCERGRRVAQATCLRIAFRAATLKTVAWGAVGLIALTTAVALGDDPPALSGVWVIEQCEEDGAESRYPLGDQFHFAEAKLTIQPRYSKRKIETAFRLDPTQTPKRIEITFTIEDKPQVAHGIYTLENDRLKICLAQPLLPRPDDFKTMANDGRRLIVLKKAPAL